MKDTTNSFIQKNVFEVSVIIMIFMLIFPMSSLLLELFLGIEFALVIGVMIYSFINHHKAMPKLVVYFCLFSLVINICLTRFSLIGIENREQLSFVQFMEKYINRTDVTISFIISIILFSVTEIVISKEYNKISDINSKFSLKLNQRNSEIENEDADKLKKNIQQELNFYSNIEAASKFLVVNTKVLTVIITINLIAGVMIQMLLCKSSIKIALESVVIILSENMIVFSIPMLIISLAIGFDVSKKEKSNL